MDRMTMAISQGKVVFQKCRENNMLRTNICKIKLKPFSDSLKGPADPMYYIIAMMTGLNALEFLLTLLSPTL